MKHPFDYRQPLSAALFFGLVQAGPSLAQEMRAVGTQPLGEIVVTAQKREQNIQDVGVAVTAVGKTELDLINRSDATALQDVVPSLKVQQYSPALTVYNIRGVSQQDFSDHQEGPIAFYNDEVYLSTLGAIAGQTFDVERIEVLRGPQGTLFGRNATGGLIQAVTNKPSSTWDGYATVTYGDFDQFATEAAIGGPLSDSVGFRLSFTSDYHDGYYTNISPGGDDGGDERFMGGRAQLAFDITDNDTLSFKAEYLTNDQETSGVNGRATGFDNDSLGFLLGPNDNFYGTCPQCTVFGYQFNSDVFKNNPNLEGNKFDRDFYNLTARYEHAFEAGPTLISITNYQNLDKSIGLDVDSTPFSLVQVDNDQDLEQYSQEFRLASQSERLNWVVGIFGMKIDTDIDSNTVIDPAVAEFFAGFPLGSFGTDNHTVYSQDTTSYAGFAQADIKFSDVFTLVIGGRYTHDDIDYSFNTVSTPFAPFPPQSYDFNARRPDLTSVTFDNWSGKLQLEARVGNDALLYVGVNRGTKAGGFNAPRTFPLVQQFPTFPDYLAALAAFDELIPFDEEELTNYEGGVKLTMAEGRATLNGSVFYYDYDNYQAFTNNDANLLIRNVPAKISGAELEFTARPVANFYLSGFVTYLFEATAEDVELPGPQPGIPGRIVDRDMPNAPDTSVGLTASLDIGKFRLSTTWKYDSSMFFTTFNSQFDHEDSHTVGNVRVSFAPTDNWEIAGFVYNVTDEEYRIFASDNSSFISVGEDGWAKPRWWGASVTYRFGK
jgi:iron complex outermembrane receptor protein